MVSLELLFPSLSGTAYEVTSPAQPEYNCIAWAAGDNSRWWEPAPDYYWPEGVSRQYTVRAYLEAFQTLGYEFCQDGDLEEGMEKVALFADSVGNPTHAARQLDDGTWTSKLGQLEDIRHIDLDHISGSQYGNPVLVLQRPRNDSKPLVNNSNS